MALRGRDWYLARVKTFLTQFPEAVNEAIGQEASTIQRLAIDQCPVDSGVLHNSSTCVSVGTPDNPRWRIAFGTNYAIFVHERVDLIHPNGKAKFLEDPINYNKPVYVQNLWRRSSANLRKAGL